MVTPAKRFHIRSRSGVAGGMVGLWLALILGLANLTSPTAVQAHALLHEVLDVDAMVLVEFFFPDGDRPYFESYRVMGPDQQRPFQTGRINAAGQVSFRPDRPGTWRVIVATEDGHGAEVRITVDPDGLSVAHPGGRGLSQASRITAAVGYLLGVFGIIALWRMRRARRPPA